MDNTSQISKSPWSQRYGERHRLHRITNFPQGLTPPKRVRIYQRGNYFVLQWWDPQAKQNLPDRVRGDLLEALVRARQIESRLTQQGSSGLAYRHISHEELLAAFQKDLQQRTNAGDIRPATAKRFAGALQHYHAFVQQAVPPIPNPARINREVALQFAAYLKGQLISPNGHPNTQRRRMKSCPYVLDVVRSMYAWAADPARGHLLPADFINPFRHAKETHTSLVGEPDITISMATSFLRACDGYQLRLFVPLLLYGLRASEPCMLFHEQLQDGWLKVECLSGLEYTTKGQRDKWLPLTLALENLLNVKGPATGLLFVQREANPKRFPLYGASLAALTDEYQRQTNGIRDAAERQRIRDSLLSQAGGLSYDHIDREFRQIHKRLGWPASATLKDFRHLFATCMQNAGVPDRYIQYLMGHTQGQAALVNYTHLNQVRQHYQRAVQEQMGMLLECLPALADGPLPTLAQG